MIEEGIQIATVLVSLPVIEFLSLHFAAQIENWYLGLFYPKPDSKTQSSGWSEMHPNMR